MLKHPWRRIAAWLVDWLVISAWIVVLFALGVTLLNAGVLGESSLLLLNVLSFAVLILPVTLALAVGESRGATLGKRALRLRVTDATTGGRVGLGHALIRNALKIAVPWAIGHAAVYQLVATDGQGTPAWLVALTVAAYVLPILWIISLFVRTGRTPYDLVAKTRVDLAESAQEGTEK